jgi:hypothetical protein
MNTSTTSLIEWSFFLDHIKIENDHPIICQNNDGSMPVSKDEYNDKIHQKLSLSEIVQITEQVLNQHKLWANSYLNFHAFKLKNEYIHFSKIESTNFKDKISSFYHACLKENEIFNQVKGKLAQMSKKAWENRTKEKNESLWGFFKYYLYYLFFDQSSRISSLQFNPIRCDFKKEALKATQEKILYLMSSFHEISDEHAGDWIDVNIKIFTSSEIVKKQFIIKNHPDKNPLMSEDLKEQATAIIALNKFWSELENERMEQATHEKTAKLIGPSSNRLSVQ